MSEKRFITGASKECDWLLPWWYNNFSKHNTENVPLTIFDFGLSDKARAWCEKMSLDVQKPIAKCKGWFYKPTALREAKGGLKVWIDVDCEIKRDISELFDFIVADKLTCGIDRYHSWGCKYQTGVVGVKGDPKILQRWEESCKDPQGPFKRGDQELLWDLVQTDSKDMAPFLPEKYNWLRMAFYKNKGPRRLHYDCRIIHWTGSEGKQIIIKSIKQKVNTIDIVNQITK